MLENAGSIAAAVNIPVTADLGRRLYNVIVTVKRALQCQAAGAT
jgi:2-methylisocitrate lyase-like PEP mutase family enzyme